jgi:hypothetical protein
MTDPQPSRDDRLASLERSLGELHGTLAQAVAGLRTALDQQGQQTQAALAQVQEATTRRALELAPMVPVKTSGPAHTPRLRVLVPDGSPALDVLSLVAWLTQVLDLKIERSAPAHLRRYFVEVEEEKLP